MRREFGKGDVIDNQFNREFSSSERCQKPLIDKRRRNEGLFQQTRKQVSKRVREEESKRETTGEIERGHAVSAARNDQRPGDDGDRITESGNGCRHGLLGFGFSDSGVWFSRVENKNGSPNSSAKERAESVANCLSVKKEERI